MVRVVVCSDAESELFSRLADGAAKAGDDCSYYACNSGDVVAVLDQHRPSVLVIGVATSGPNEVEPVIGAVRSCARHAALPIICATSPANRVLAEAALAAGATEVFAENDLSSLLDFVAELTRSGITKPLSGKILLVEDSQEYAAYLIDLCEEIGLTVELVATVSDAIALLKTRAYDLVVTDIVLDDAQSGLALVRYLRANDAGVQPLPILVISAFDDPVRRAEAD